MKLKNLIQKFTWKEKDKKHSGKFEKKWVV